MRPQRFQLSTTFSSEDRVIIKCALKNHFDRKEDSSDQRRLSSASHVRTSTRLRHQTQNVNFLSNLLSYHVLLKAWSRWHSDPWVSDPGPQAELLMLVTTIRIHETGRHPPPLLTPLPLVSFRRASRVVEMQSGGWELPDKCQMDLFFLATREFLKTRPNICWEMDTYP